MQALSYTMETDGSPPHCIIYKHGFLHVSITPHCECAHAHLCMYLKRVCVCFVHMLTNFLLPLCIWDQVCAISVTVYVSVHISAYLQMHTRVCLEVLFHCLPVFVCCVSAWAYSHFRCVYVQYLSVCTYANISQVEFFFYSPVCGRNSLLIKLLFFPPSLSQSPSCWPFCTVKSSCCTSLFISSWTACLSSWLLANKIHKFHFSKTNRRCVK